MSRIYSAHCPDCGLRYMQDWEDPDECPRCHNEQEEEEKQKGNE